MQRPPIWYNKEVHHHRTMIKDLPAEINDYDSIDWESGLREFRDEMDPCLFDAVSWVEDVYGIPFSQELVDQVEKVLLENDWYTNPNSVMSYHHY